MIAAEVSELDSLRQRLAELEHETAMLRSVVQDQTEVVCRFKPDGTFLFVNDVFCRLFGRCREELIGHSWRPNAHPDDLPHIEERLALLSPQNPVVRIENRSFIADGQVRWMEFVNRGFFTDDGTLYEIQAVGRDIHEHKLAKAALIESEARFRAFMDCIPMGAWIVGADGRCEFVNRRYCEMVQQPPEHIQGKTAFDLYPLDVARIHRDNDLQMLASGQPLEVVENYTRPDGSPGELMVVKFPIRDSQGVAKVGGVCLDVTESRKTQTALAEREMLLRKLGDNLPGGAIYQFLLHPDGRVEFPYVSAGIEDVLGITAEEIMAQPELVYGMIESDDLEAHNQAQAISLAQLSTFDHEFRCRRPDGEVVWIHCRSAPRRLANGAAIWEGVFIDTTEAHRIQDELRRSEEHYRFLTESIPQLVWIYDAEGRPSYFNRRWYEYTGQTVEQSMSDRWHESLHPDDVALAITTWNSVKNVGSDYRVEYRLRRHDGVYRWHLSQAWPLITADGRINGWFGTCTDVHAARTVQEELTRSLHQREVLLREVHHRVKNNLQVIISLLHLQSVRVHEKAALEALRDSQHRVRAMALVHEHLYRTGDLSHIPMANYIRGLAEALARSFNVPQIQVAMEIEPFDLTIDQAVPCGLILAELITNAYKHAFPSGQSGQIRITATRAPGCDPILLRVADNGIGLRPEPTGRPLGLTIVQDLTRQLRGTVALHHDGGLQVEIRFPCSLAFSEA